MGIFGSNELDLPWEKLDFVDKLQAKLLAYNLIKNACILKVLFV